jgi:hypothetical protein
MEALARFAAPWGSSLKRMTTATALILTGIALIGIFSGPAGSTSWVWAMVVLPVAMLSVSSLFAIRGYALTAQALIVARPGWSSKIDLCGLVSAEADPGAMDASIRTFGNGGMFCIAGAFHNKKLGSYRAFATDPKRAVVLRFPERTVVVTPDNPEAFVVQVKELRGLSF